jgi:hypothetical protein
VRSGTSELPKTSTEQYPLRSYGKSHKLLHQNYHQQSCPVHGKTSPISNLLYRHPAQRLRFDTYIRQSVYIIHVQIVGTYAAVAKPQRKSEGNLASFMATIMEPREFESDKIDKNLWSI